IALCRTSGAVPSRAKENRGVRVAAHSPKIASRCTDSAMAGRLRLLELQFERELHLARRTEVAGREARALDHAEGSRCRGENRVAEVRVIEDIEHLRAELEIEAFGDLRVLKN